MTPIEIRFKGHPLVAIVVIDFMTDRYGAYAGTVVEIKNTWVDRLTLDFIPVEHLVIETAEGEKIDKLVSVENRAFFRIEVGDRVVKKRGFSNHARVPGKQTVGEMLEATRR